MVLIILHFSICWVSGPKQIIKELVYKSYKNLDNQGKYTVCLERQNRKKYNAHIYK